MQYRKRPIVIRAAKWVPGVNDEIVTETGIINGGDRRTDVHTHGQGVHSVPAGFGLIPTLEGPHVVTPGDWIIIGINGERYPCKPDIFEKTYEALDEFERTYHGEDL
jgi:hypothetical protein